MINRLRKFIKEENKEKIMHSLPYRLYERLKLKNHPINFSVELTTKCNAFCNMCTRASLIKQKKLDIKNMSPEILNKVLEEMKKFYKAGKKIFFSPMGLGESLLYPDLYELFKEIKKIGNIPIVIATNGITLNNQASQKLIDLGVDEIIISLNTNNPKTYKSHMGVNTYNLVKKNAENLIKIRNESNKKTPRIYIQYLDYKNNLDKYADDIKNWLKIMKYNDKCFVHPIANQAGFYPGSTNIEKQNFPCPQPFWRIAIKINGDIYPCDPCFYSGSEKVNSLYIGNIKDVDLYEQFFSKGKRAEIINQMKQNNYSSIPNCEKCNTYKLGSNPFFKLPFSKKWF